MQDVSSKQQTKQKFKSSNQQIGLPPHSALPIRGKTNKNSAQISHTEAYTDYQTNLKRAETKRKKEFNLLQGKNSTFLEASDRDLKHKFKKIIMKTQRNIIQMQEQTRNTEIQINEEEIGKLHEKEFKIMIVKMIRNLENKMEKL